MKKLTVIIMLLAMVALFSGCGSNLTSIVDNAASGPEQYADTMGSYYDTMGSLMEDVDDEMIAELISVMGMIEEFFDNAEWDSADSSWSYEYTNGSTSTVVEIDTYGADELKCHWEVSIDDVFEWGGDAYYHPDSDSFKIQFESSGRKFWLEFAASDDGNSYFTQLAYEDIGNADVYLAKIWALNDGSYIIGRVNDQYPLSAANFTDFVYNVSKIYKNAPDTWDGWKTMPYSVWYEFDWDATNGYSGAWND